VPPGKGHQIFKFSPAGKLLMTLGTAGGARGDSSYFWQPNDIAFAPNGDIFVSEGHSSADTANARILKFSKSGKLLQTWGKHGTGPTDFDQPHSLAFDSKGRLFVADRGNNRIMIFTTDGKLLDTWYQFSRPSAIYIDAADNLYVGDSESGTINKAHGAWKRGIRIGSVKDGVVRYFIPDPDLEATGTSSAEGVAVDAAGHIYGAEVGQKALKRYERP
jgi:sugar lactone lactonase YvrE